MLTEVATKIAERGGVQEISMRKGDSMSQKDKATTAQAALLKQSLAVIDSSQVKASINIEKKQEQAVAVLTQKDVVNRSHVINMLVAQSQSCSASTQRFSKFDLMMQFSS